MKRLPAYTQILRATAVSFCLCWQTGCEKPAQSDGKTGREEESYTADERAAGAKLKPVKDPISEKIYKFRVQVRQAYNNRRFDDLEGTAGHIRAAKSTFGNGSWMIAQFYESLECRHDEPESMWQLHDQIHRDWIATKPQSLTAQLAYADFLVEYGWHARGSGYADKVTTEGWQLFRERLAAARKLIEGARSWPEKDPFCWVVALEIAMGQQWSKPSYDALVTEAHAIEPSFWGYDTARAFSLLPRWYGEPGDWEAYAEQTSARPDSLGPELYARIVVNLSKYYDNVFQESKASWPKTRAGLEAMRRKYPDWLEPVSDTAMLATLAHDYTLAREMFELTGDTYSPNLWGKPERFARFRNLAKTDGAGTH